MLFPYRDLPSNNQKTQNLEYIDAAKWEAWGSIDAGRLPTPKPDLCITFKKTAFTASELDKLKSPYISASSIAPSLTLEILGMDQAWGAAANKTANNMIHLLMRDYALQHARGTHKQMERRIRFVSTIHDTDMQEYQAWFYIIDSEGNPKWCSYVFENVYYGFPGNGGFQKARQYNLNLCEYISDTVFRELRNTLNGVSGDTAMTS